MKNYAFVKVRPMNMFVSQSQTKSLINSLTHKLTNGFFCFSYIIRNKVYTSYLKVDEDGQDTNLIYHFYARILTVSVSLLVQKVRFFAVSLEFGL